MYRNWFGRDFTLTMGMVEGNGTVSVGYTGQLDPRQNLLSAMPFNDASSKYSFDVQQGQSLSLPLNGSECYGCWYLIRV